MSVYKSKYFSVNIDFNDDVFRKFSSAMDDDFFLEAHRYLAQICDKYVPFDEGILATTLNITPEYLEYASVYAHYMYYGEVMGPNIPQFDEDGNLIGFVSPPKKHYTGKPITYSKEMHPLATKEWDKIAMQNELDTYLEHMKNYLLRKVGE